MMGLPIQWAKLGTNPFVATSKPSVPAALADAKLWFDAANVDGQNNSTLSSVVQLPHGKI